MFKYFTSNNMNYYLKHVFSFLMVFTTVIFIFTNVYFNYYNLRYRKQTEYKKTSLNYLKLDNRSIDEKKDYYNSINYKQKLFKLEGLKGKNEVVIDFAAQENYLSSYETDYIPNIKTDKNTNFLNWFNCLFITETATTKGNTLCK